MRRDRVLRILREHESELREMHVSSLELFGSVARGDDGPESDVDLLVEFGRPIGLFHLVGVKLHVEELLGVPVDLGMRRAVRKALRERIYGEAIRVFGEAHAADGSRADVRGAPGDDLPDDV